MNPIYKFTLSADGGDERAAFPVYRDDLSKDFELQSNEEFYRAKLSGKLTFVRDDYDFIAGEDFDTQFGLKIYISYDAGATWTEYWTGQFWKTNCKFNADDKNVTLTPEVLDRYTDVLAGMEKEYNLIELAPQIVPVKLDKRPMIQVYVPGQSVIGCFLSGMWWEQQCTPESDTAILEQTGDGKPNFALNRTVRIVDVTQSGTPEIPDVFVGDAWDVMGTTEFTNGAYKFRHYGASQSGGSVEQFLIIRVSDEQIMWWVQFSNQNPQTYPLELTLQPYDGSGATGTVKVYIHDMPVYARYICDVDVIGSVNTFTLGDDDIVPNNRNYSRVIGYYFPDTIFYSKNLSITPTPWGLYQPGKYYDQPSGSWYFGEFYPVSRNAWGRISIWFAFYAFDWIIEQQARQEYTLRDAFPLASVISVLLAQVAPNLTHLETTDYSQFLYGTNPLLGINQRIFITPKSNMVTLGYDQPAQKAPITLKRVLDMLRDCFRCYWFVDDQNRFRIEHIEYFRRGGAYTGTPVVGRDLTVEQVTRNGKKWAFGTSQFQFDKPEMASRYQFGWMDDVTQLFEGNPIDIVSKYVNPDNIEQIDISQFTSDVDYILLNPGEISKDGFVLLSAIYINRLTTIYENYGEIAYYESGNPYTQPCIGMQTPDNISGIFNKVTTAPIRATSNLVANYSVVITTTPNNPQSGKTIKTGTLSLTSTFKQFDIICDGQISVGEKLVIYLWTTTTTHIWLLSQRTPIFSNDTQPLIFLIGRQANPLSESWYSGSLPNYATPSPILTFNENIYKLPYINFELNSVDHYLQNAYAAFIWLQQYYFWDMPARYFKYNGEQIAAQGIKKLKTQTLKFPMLTDPNTLQLIKTNLGNGTIQKMSVNLSSRNANATLKYDTE